MRQCRGFPYSTVKICAGQDAHGCVQLIMNRRVTVSFVNRSATSGSAFLRALVSILEEVTAFQVIRRGTPRPGCSQNRP